MTAESASRLRLPETVTLAGRMLALRASERALRALSTRQSPLDIEMELYFSCLLRKRVRFLDQPHSDVAVRGVLLPAISVSFRPVMTRACRVGDVDEAPDLQAVSLIRTAAFIPRWLRIDHRADWIGEFGY